MLLLRRSENTEIAADADVVLARISEGLKTEWSRAIDELGYDSESNSGFAGPTRDAWEVFEQIGPIFANDAFEEFVVKAFDGEVWCQRDPYGTTVGEALRYGWRISPRRSSTISDSSFFFRRRDARR